MQEYVVGFLFDEKAKEYHKTGLGSVALINKIRPTWQAGRLNGIGGHVERGEFPDDAIRREFIEEAGVSINSWEYKLKYEGPTYVLYVYSAFSDSLWDVISKTDEKVEMFSIEGAIGSNTIYNLEWFIPFLLDPCVGINNKVYEN